MEQYYFTEPEITREEMVAVLVKGLGRELTQQETNTIRWLNDWDYTTRGVILDLFKELIEKRG